jgi:hypothetical protein
MDEGQQVGVGGVEPAKLRLHRFILGKGICDRWRDLRSPFGKALTRCRHQIGEKESGCRQTGDQQHACIHRHPRT